MSVFDLGGKTAVVTGASRGLGQSMALSLAEAGADIVAVSSSSSSDTVEKVRALGRRAYEVRADLGKTEELKEVVRRCLEAAGQIDILINNAGIIRRAPVSEHSWEDFEEVLNLNLKSVFGLTQLIGNHMIERGGGKIINIASMLSFQGGINVPGYTASKHGVAGLTKAFANEWASKGVQVNAIAPGYMSTDNTAAIRGDKERNDSITARIPAGRWGTGEDVGGPAVFLSSSASDYVNGHILCVDGGWMNR